MALLQLLDEGPQPVGVSELLGGVTVVRIRVLGLGLGLEQVGLGLGSGPPRRRSPASSRHPRTLRARTGSASTVQALGHVGLELGAASGTCGPSFKPRRRPQTPEHPPRPLHQNTTKKF